VFAAETTGCAHGQRVVTGNRQFFPGHRDVDADEHCRDDDADDERQELVASVGVVESVCVRS
jgi:hypothetical protein